MLHCDIENGLVTFGTKMESISTSRSYIICITGKYMLLGVEMDVRNALG